MSKQRALKIGVMLRAYDKSGGIGIYSRNILKHLLTIDERNEYVLFHSNSSHLGSYGANKRVTELYLPPRNPIIWDQISVPRAAKGLELDLIFNTKFSVPLFCNVKRVMVLHGASWFVRPELYGRFDIFYVRRAMPIYCSRADFLISNSDLTTRDFKRLLKVPDEKVRTVNLAAGPEFRPVSDAVTLEKVRDNLSLPKRFLLTVSSYDPRKNFWSLLAAFERVRRKVDVELVVTGKDCFRYKSEAEPSARGLFKHIHFPGWVDQADLPAVYSLAAAFVFPSVYEEFGIPIVEAMSCGCPIVSSNTGAIPDLTQGAALLCDPFDVDQLGENVLRVLSSEDTAQSCRERGLERAKDFSWTKTAEETLAILESVGSS